MVAFYYAMRLDLSQVDGKCHLCFCCPIITLHSQNLKSH